jgi:hypothetical protein
VKNREITNDYEMNDVRRAVTTVATKSGKSARPRSELGLENQKYLVFHKVPAWSVLPSSSVQTDGRCCLFKEESECRTIHWVRG